MPSKDFTKAWSEIVARAWKDEKFKKKLLSNPKEAAKEFGLDIPADANIQVVENTEKNRYFILPRKPSVELSEEEFKKVVGGAKSGSWDDWDSK